MEFSVLLACALLLLLEALKGLQFPKTVSNVLPLGGSSITQIGIVLAIAISVTQIAQLFKG